MVEIYKQDVGGVQVFKCPFCDEEPQASDIKFRKHLKSQHPTRKTLLKYSKKSTQIENFNARELRDVEKLYKLVEPVTKPDIEHEAEIYLNPTENQIVNVTAHNVKVGTQAVIRSLFDLLTAQDISGSQMVVVDQDSVEDVVLAEPQKKPMKARRGRPLSENALKVQQLVENCYVDSDYVNAVDSR